MTTKVYGASDDMVAFDGDVNREAGFYHARYDKKGALLICSDGTLLRIRHGKGDAAFWKITLLKRGSLFGTIEARCDEDGEPHSDIAHFHDGLHWAYIASQWEPVA